MESGTASVRTATRNLLYSGETMSSQANTLNAAPTAAKTLRSQVDAAVPYVAELTDEALMLKVQQGDRAALGLLFDRYSRLVFGVAVRILRDASEAQELVQDIFLYLYRKGQNFDPAKSCLRSWLVQVVYSRSFDRRDYLKCRRFYDYSNIEEMGDLVPSGESLEIQAENRSTLAHALSKLSERQRLTLELFFFEGCPLEEISVRLDESLTNTRNHYYRGLQKLRHNLKNAAGTEKSRCP